MFGSVSCLVRSPQTPAAPKSGVSAFVDSLKKEKEGVKEGEGVKEEESKENQGVGRSPLSSVVELLSSLALTQGEAKVVITRCSPGSGLFFKI